MTAFWHCFPVAARILAPAAVRATRRALPVHPGRPRSLRRFRDAPAAVPTLSATRMVCIRVAALAAPLALGPAALPATPFLPGAAYAPLGLLDRGPGRDGVPAWLRLGAQGVGPLDGPHGPGAAPGPDTGGLLPGLPPPVTRDTATAVPEPHAVALALLPAALAATLITRRTRV